MNSIPYDAEITDLVRSGKRYIADLHPNIANTSPKTRFSIDRTLNVASVKNQRGAPNVDSSCKGTNLLCIPQAR
jgi:hypothetical protein